MKEYIKDFIIEHLNYIKGEELRKNEFADRLHEAESINGSITCNAKASQEFIKAHLDYIASRHCFDTEDFKNKPELVHCEVVLPLVDRIASELIEDYTDEYEVIIDDDLINFFNDNINDTLAFLE